MSGRHLLFVSHSSALAGAELSLVNLVREVGRSSEDRCTVVLPGDGPLVDRLRAADADCRVVVRAARRWMGPRQSGVIGVLRLGQALADTAAWVRLLGQERPDVVVVNSSVIPAPLLAAHLTRTPVTLMLRETLSPGNASLRSALPKRTMSRLLSRWSDQVLAVSEHALRTFGHTGTVIYPQVDPVFLGAAAPGGEARTSSPELRLVMCGSIQPEKGQLDAVAALQRATARGLRASLDIYGGGAPSDIARLRDAIARTEEATIRYHGETHDVLPRVQAADVALVCSRNEAFGKVTAEAILCGTPVLGYDRGGTSEVLRHGGGLLVPPDVGALSEAMRALAEDQHLRQRLIDECRDHPVRPRLEGAARAVLEAVVSLTSRSEPRSTGPSGPAAAPRP